MNYKKHYDLLINRAKYRVIDDYTEAHHIIPKCLGGINDEDNLVRLTAREHFIAHGLLAKIYKNSSEGYKLISAFRFMSVDSHSGNRITNRDFEWMRKMYISNHPMKQLHIKKKCSDSLKKFWCNNESARKRASETTLKWNKEHPEYFKSIKIPLIISMCECGCDEKFEKKITSPKRFIYGHHVIQTDSRKKKISDSLKRTLSVLSATEMHERLNKSFGACDHKKRGESISAGKRGKTTNQKQIEIVKYSSMSENEFSEYIKNRTKNVKTRMINRRIEGLKLRKNI